MKNIKCGKSSGIDGISAEHFVFAHSRIHVVLSLLFSAFLMHGYLPSMFMKTASVPIIKNKTGDTRDKNNYRPKCNVGCYIDNLCMNVMYADDICLMAPSPAALQELIDICYDFSVQNGLSFNSSKSYCMVFKPKSF